jgi:hypothetical protein
MMLVLPPCWCSHAVSHIRVPHGNHNRSWSFPTPPPPPPPPPSSPRMRSCAPQLLLIRNPSAAPIEQRWPCKHTSPISLPNHNNPHISLSKSLTPPLSLSLNLSTSSLSLSLSLSLALPRGVQAPKVPSRYRRYRSFPSVPPRPSSFPMAPPQAWPRPRRPGTPGREVAADEDAAGRRLLCAVL